LKLYEYVLKPFSPFGTTLRGDTLFGHFCWQCRYDGTLLEGGFEHWIKQYPQKPFAVFSSVCFRLEKGAMRYAVKRPDVPLEWLFSSEGKSKREIFEERKKNAARRWLLLAENLSMTFSEKNLVNNDGLFKQMFPDWEKSDVPLSMKQEIDVNYLQAHNTVNRETMTTGEGMFAPYNVSATWFFPETRLALFVLVEEEATDKDLVRKALERIGASGYGRDSSIGYGRFMVEDCFEKSIPRCEDANACYTLAPSVPIAEYYEDFYFTPFTRFGKHGDTLATGENPFKNPVIMADEGAILFPVSKEQFHKPYLGKALQALSKSEPNTVSQGYAFYLPLKWEKKS
jgi:CRISPR-associated protein Csm4